MGLYMSLIYACFHSHVYYTFLLASSYTVINDNESKPASSSTEGDYELMACESVTSVTLHT